jgi:hypothetical protein
MKFTFNKIIEDLVKEYPNDSDLGKKVRELYNTHQNLKNNKDGIQEKDTKEG